ncbi:MAG: 2Fe-2S iron-sulfur cluster binding domain-containing protein [Gemmatimonadetes bacterium]|nr:2Fe-2S iron-sulfur cluster binding domain-containing protein [Gemmatimonadota bacterium]
MTAPAMVNLTIEGRPVSVPAGTSILEAAKAAGVLIPHYCYHPGLPVAGVCRMCLVDVEKAPKLMPSCATTVAEGQVVRVHDDKSLEARKGVLEMLLINHPLDCPICDQSGECELQDYTFQEGRADSRYREPKRFNPVEDFGGDVLYVPNRCILCTRCVRFMDDVQQESALCVAERGDRAVIAKAPDADLTQAWAGNVVDLCPVGALLSKDFLNKARAWELDRAPSICTGCSQGCNVTLETRDNAVVRIKPRGNPDVNAFFICDEGRLNYRWMNRQDRCLAPTAAGTECHWDAAVAAAASALNGKRAHIVANASLGNEAFFLLGVLAKKTGGSVRFTVPQGPEALLPGVEDLALRADRAANAYGAELLGASRADDPYRGLGAGDTLVLVDVDPASVPAGALAAAGRVVYLGTVVAAGVKAAAVLPIANIAEHDGTVTNLRGHVQRYFQARPAPGHARPAWSAVADLLIALKGEANFLTAADAFAAMAKAHAAFAGMTFDQLGTRGAAAAGATAGAGR